MTVAEPRDPYLTPHERDIARLAWEWSLARTTVSAESIHGPRHWRRVSRLGLRIARQEGADALVVAVFAACHDVARIHDGRDMEHGPLGARRVRDELAAQLGLAETRLDLLLVAITEHTWGRVSSDPTIGACWDVDRLDLVRIGFALDPDLLSTASARSGSLQEAAARLWARDRRFRIQAGLPVPNLFATKDDP